MVKNEAPNLPRSLKAIKPYIQSWVITDTGSADNTVKVVQDMLGDLPGQIRYTPWQNWGYNRTDAIKAALEYGKDWAFILDADEEVHDLVLPPLDPSMAYWIDIHYGGVVYARPNVINAKQEWKYEGVTHEYLHSPQKPPNVKLSGYIQTDPARATKTPEKCAKDAELLEEALKSEPENTRYMFYLAQSYRDSGQPDKAITWYRKRAEAGGWVEEVYISRLRIAQIMSGRFPAPMVMEAFKDALNARPERAGETMRNLARYANWCADNAPFPKHDTLFVETGAYSKQ
jgi:glycosyltransferase involved in cell wall biosynthesis